MDAGKENRKKRSHWYREAVEFPVLGGEAAATTRLQKKYACICRRDGRGNGDNGFVFSSREIKVKIHNLTNKYRDEKKVVGPSGGTPSVWEYYDKVHHILGGYKYFNLEAIVGESVVETLQIETEEECSTSSQMQASSVEFALELSAQPPKKRRKDNENFQYAFLEEFRAANQTIAREIQELKEDSREAQQSESERNGILEKILEAFKQNR